MRIALGVAFRRKRLQQLLGRKIAAAPRQFEGALQDMALEEADGAAEGGGAIFGKHDAVVFRLSSPRHWQSIASHNERLTIA